MKNRPLTILANDYASSIPGSGAHVKGGPLRFSIGLREHLVAEGFRWVGVIGQKKQPAKSLAYAHPDRTWEIHKVGVPHARLEAIREDAPASLRAARAWAAGDLRNIDRLFAKVAPDVVFLNGYSAYSWMLLEVAIARGVPVAIQHAGVFALEVRQYAELFGEAGRRLCYAMERETATGASANIFLNAHSVRSFAKALRLREPTRGETIIPLPHPDWEFQKARFAPKSSETRTIGVVARWDRIKNVEAILAFAEEALRRGLPWKLRVVTKIPDTPVRAEFKARFREIIEVVPQMEAEKIRDFYQSCDAMPLPSHFETLGAVVMEAVSVGVPTLISANVGWIDDYAASAMKAWVADFSKPRLAVKILGAHLSRARWPEVERFAKMVSRRHDPARVYASYVRLIRQAARSHKNPR